MPSSAIITSVLTGGVAYSPSEQVFTYRVLRASDLTDLGALRGVLNEPVFKGSLNQGCAALQLDLDHQPIELSYGNLIRVNYPNGQVAGYWKYEQSHRTLNPGAIAYQITLAPLVSELSDADFNGNYSTDTTQPTGAIGPQRVSQMVSDCITRTVHCTAGVISDNGALYSYVFNNSTPANVLAQAITFMGASWWWYTDSVGVVSLRNSSPYNHVVTYGCEVTSGEQTEDMLGLFNGYPVIGGTPPGATASLTAFAMDTNPANPYSIPNIGRRTAQPYSDTSLMDQASVNAVAVSLLAYHERITRQQTLRLTNYSVRRPQPGDAITIRYVDADPAGIVGGPYLIIDVTEYGATQCYELVVSADMTVPLGLMPTLGQDQAVAKLMQNPFRSALSPDGTAGTIGSGVVGGTGGGVGYTAVPHVPTGLTAATGIDLLAQTNNAFVSLVWSNAATTDVVTNFEVQWRKLGDSLYYHARTGVAAVKIPGLIQGQIYAFSVRAQNDLGNYSAWSAELNVVAGSDNIAPATPSGLTAVRTPRGALVTWGGNTEKDLQGYVLQVSVAGGGFTPVVASPSLHTSFAYIAPSGTPIGSTLVFQVAAVDWTGNQSGWSTASANTPTDGVYFDEVMTGNLTATGTITGGMIRTAPSGARVEMDNAGIRLFDGTVTDYGSGVGGLTSRLRSTDGTAFFSGVVSASSIISNSPIGQPSMTINMVSTPQMLVNDGSINRVQIGSLASGGYGISVLAADSTVILDTNGLVKVMNRIGGNNSPSFADQGFTTTWTNVPSSNGAFTLSRAGTVLILSQANFYTSGGTASYGQARVAVFTGGGSFVVATPWVTHSNGSGVSSGNPYAVVNLAAGSYTGWWQYQLVGGATTTWTFESGQWDVFQLGS
jgi:hypothetical protein